MANLKEVRTRINSVNSTMQITSAMKMVSASKLRKSQSAITSLRPYASKLKEIMQDLSSSLLTSSESVYAKKHKDNAEDEKILIIPVASNKGLCGIFNGNIIRETIRFVNDECRIQLEKGNVDILCISKKVEEALKFKKITTIGNENSLLDNLSYDNILPFAERLMSDFSNEKYDRIIFIYNQFKNAGSQIMVHEQFLPIVSEESNDDNHSTSEIEYIFQPSKEEILNSLIPKSLKLQVYKILLDSFTSEHGARMVSMTKATDNASELLKELNRSYNKARQSTITNEIIEIVSGADAL
ncbi:MAG: ATP synthase F1 subunit gamma [Candidatus Limimorpha sp.]|nr:ATP synthase F1 subunit gamma [Bacteroidales bacterium]MDD5978981.1 ATP synthase F1 subunit gamma [Bacteroidales bacterium]